MTKQTKRTRRMVEAAILVALGTVLSVLTPFQLPYGGSITMASMLPLVLISYRHGTLFGFGAGLVYGVLQQLLGLNNLSYFTTWQSVLAVILLDYLVAFGVVGLGGVYRKWIGEQSGALVLGGLTVSFLRYFCHVIAGATVWAGLSIPTEAAFWYSVTYNATYMLPETVILLLSLWYVGSMLDFKKEQPTRLTGASHEGGVTAHGALAGLFALAAVVFDVATVFSHMQDAETGEFSVAGLQVERFAGSFWMWVVIVSAAALVLCTLLLLLRKNARTAQK